MNKSTDNDMSSMLNNLASALHNSEIPPNLKDALQSFMNNQNKENSCSSNNNSADNSTSNFTNNDFSNFDIDTILKMQKIIKGMNSEQSSSRSNLLRSLKPYLKHSRQMQVDQYIQLLNIENVLKNLNDNEKT